MNIYLVVEGQVERKVYPKWVKYLNPSLKFIEDIDKIETNCVYIVSGMGYPYYFEIIESAIEDIKSSQCFDRFVISVDSEDMTYQEKYDEINEFIQSKKLDCEYKIVIQHFCIETWALGNKIIVSRNPFSEKVRNYRAYFDVLTNDPEILPPYDIDKLNRAQFAEKYLRALLNEKYRNLTYSKYNPTTLLNRNYYERVKRRYVETNHIKSFNNFLSAFN